MADRIKHRAVIALLGAVSFWGPITLIELLAGADFFSLELSSVLPLTTLFLSYFRSRQHYEHTVTSVSVWMLLGVYVLGPLFMAIAATPYEGGFSQFHGWNQVKFLLLAMVFPPLTLVLSGYHGTIFGLLATTFVVCFVRLTLERKPRAERVESKIAP